MILKQDHIVIIPSEYAKWEVACFKLLLLLIVAQVLVYLSAQMTCVQLALGFRCDDLEILDHETLSLGSGKMLLKTNNLQANEPDPLRRPNPSLRPLNRVLDVVVRVPGLLLDTSTRRFALFACILRFDVPFALFVWLGTHYQGLSRGPHLLHDLHLIIQINYIRLVYLPNRDGETTSAHV